MGRTAKATPEELSRACAKLQTTGNLNVPALREAVGGGGAEYLTRHIRAWRHAEREAARVPVEQVLPAALGKTWGEEMKRVQQEAVQEGHQAYLEDKEHLEYVLGELRRLEKQEDALHDAVAQAQAELGSFRAASEKQVADLTHQLEEQRTRGDRLSERFDDLRRHQGEMQAELAVAREQRSVSETQRQAEATQREELQVAWTRAVEGNAEKSAQLAAASGRCMQQEEMLAYVRSDVLSKKEEVEGLRSALTAKEAESRVLALELGAARASLDEVRKAALQRRAQFFFGPRSLAQKTNSRGVSQTDNRKSRKQ